MGNLKIEVSLSPLLYQNYANPESIVVAIDVLRATSAICTAFEHGIKELIPVATIEEAEDYKAKGYLVGGERNGEQLPQFDFGNSPYSYMSEDLKDKTVVLTTTNGTKSIEIAKNAHLLCVGSFTNITALCNFLIDQKRDVILLCAGWKDKFNLEDSLFAGAVVDRLTQEEIFNETSDSALAAKYLYHAAQEDTEKFLRNSSHRKRLKKLNLKEDIKYCLSFDKTDKVPVLKNGKLVCSTTLELAAASES